MRHGTRQEARGDSTHGASCCAGKLTGRSAGGASVPAARSGWAKRRDVHLVLAGFVALAGGLPHARAALADNLPPSPGAVPVVVPGDRTGELAPAERPTKKTPPSLLLLPKPEGVPADTVLWLKPDAKRGGYSWQGPGFRARISREGDLSFEDRNTALKIVPSFIPRPNPYAVPSLQSKILNRPSPTHGLSEIVPHPEEVLTGYESPYHADPREAARVGKEKLDYGSNVPIAMVRAGFDLTEELMRLHGQDPYRYDKARFAASTRDFRAKLATRARNESLREACGRLRDTLARLAAGPALAPGAFRQAIAGLETDIDSSTAEGRALLGYLGGLQDRSAIPASVNQRLSEDEPRLCGLVPLPEPPPAAVPPSTEDAAAKKPRAP